MQCAKPFMPVANITEAGISKLACGSIKMTRLAKAASQNNILLPCAVRMPSEGVTSAPEAVMGMDTMGNLPRTKSGVITVDGGVKRLACCAKGAPSAKTKAAALAESQQDNVVDGFNRRVCRDVNDLCPMDFGQQTTNFFEQRRLGHARAAQQYWAFRLQFA